MSTSPTAIAAPELPPVNGSGASFTGATVVDEPPSVPTVPEIVVEVVAPGIVVVAPAVVTVEIVEVVTADDVVVAGTLDVVVVVTPRGVVSGGVEVVVDPTGIVEVVGAVDVVCGTVVGGAVDGVVVVGLLGPVHPLSKSAIPTAVQFLPAYFSPGPKSNGGMTSPHFVCLGIAA
jgi:hypothetical protein